MHLATSKDHVTYSSGATEAEEMHVLVFSCEFKMLNEAGTNNDKTGGQFLECFTVSCTVSLNQDHLLLTVNSLSFNNYFEPIKKIGYYF